MPLINAAPDALSRLYAASLFELAQKQGGQAMIEEVYAELESVMELGRNDFAFGEFLSSRIVPTTERAASLDRIFKGRISDLTLGFLQIVNQKDRLNHLPAIVASFDEIVNHAFGRVEVDVYTAAPLDQEEMDTIKARLQAVLGKPPVIHPYIEPTMLGGVKLQIGDQLVDASVAAELRRMRDRLVANGAAELRARASGLIN
ncbi:MAG: ATP synthase F1 subunit delta [Phycisphaerales bacterium]|nr:ATP synthase F1 subunit delta [Phycisphaerales bacterium]